MQGHKSLILRVKRDVLLEVSKMWRKCHYIQKTRVALVSEILRQLDKMVRTKKIEKGNERDFGKRK